MKLLSSSSGSKARNLGSSSANNSLGSLQRVVQHSNVPQLHGPSTHPRQTCAAAPGDSLDTVLESLRDSFGAPANATKRQQLSSEAPATSERPGFAAGRGSSSSSSSRGKQRPGARRTAAPAAPQALTAAEEPAAAPQKKRRGQFSDLISALEYEQLHPEEALTSKSSTTSSSSSTSNSDASNEQTPPATDQDGSSISTSTSTSTSTSSSTSTSISTSSSTSSSKELSSIPRDEARPAVRRIRQGAAAARGQQQQRQQLQPQPARVLGSSQQQQEPKQQQQQLPPWLLQQQAESAASGGRVKQYKPVPKGDLLLPGGPAWSGLRRHVVAAGADPSLPTLDCIVIVEGDNDQKAVCRAVNATVYVCDGTRALKEHVRPELSLLPRLGRRLVVLTDPDERGRELRGHLDDLIGPLHHAFVPEQQGTSDTDGPLHSAGNRGIEHVVPLGVQRALAAAQPSWPKDRAVWGPEDLQRLQLANAFDAGHEGVVRGPGGAAARRRQLCALLGLGRCTAAQLLGALNRYFSEEQLEAALQQLDAQLAQ